MAGRTERYAREIYARFARRRFAERYGVRVTDNDLRRMAEYIQGGHAPRLAVRSKHARLYAVPAGAGGEPVPVVYTVRHGAVMTVLPTREMAIYRPVLEAHLRTLAAAAQGAAAAAGGRAKLPPLPPPSPPIQLVRHEARPLVWVRCDPLLCPFDVTLYLRPAGGGREAIGWMAVEKPGGPRRGQPAMTRTGAGDRDGALAVLRDRFTRRGGDRPSPRAAAAWAAKADRFLAALERELDKAGLTWAADAPTATAEPAPPAARCAAA